MEGGPNPAGGIGGRAAAWLIVGAVCLAVIGACFGPPEPSSSPPADNTPTGPSSPAAPPAVASVAGTITVQQAAGQVAVYEREPNNTIEQAQFIATAAPGDKYIIFGNTSVRDDTFDAYQFSASGRVGASLSLSYATQGVARRNDFDIGVYDFTHLDCYPGSAGPPTFAQCFDSSEAPEIGSFDIEGPFVLVVIPYRGSGAYQLEVAFTPAASPSTQPAARAATAKGPPPPASVGSFDDVAGRLVPDEVLVTFDPAADEATRARALAASGLMLIEASPSGLCRARQTPNKLLAPKQRAALTCSAANCLAAQPGVLTASPNYIRHIAVVPNDEHYGLQWHYPLINLPQAWDITTGGDDVVVAVIDTGIVSRHPDLAGRLTTDGYDFIADPASARDGDGRDADPDDPGDLFGGPGQSSFHGTHVAGTIAARTNNGIGVAGVTWLGKVMPLRAVGVGGGSDFDVSEAIRYAAGLANISGRLPTRKANVINLSLSGGAGVPGSDAIHAAIQAASASCLVVAAAGNENSSLPSYPGAFSEAVSVGAVDLAMQRAPYSNYGPWVSLVAPGGNLGSDVNGDGWADGVLSTAASDADRQIRYQYRFENGTSMAAPHVAGVAALLFAANPALTAADVRDILQSTARDLGNPGRDDLYGYGLVDAAAAVQEARRRAGGAAMLNPRLTLSTGSLDFGTTDTTLRVAISNTGGGMLTITNVVAETLVGEGWLAANVEGRSGNANATQLVVSVNRANLPPGTYRGRVTLDADSLASQSVEVRMAVGGNGTTDEPIYVLVVDPVTLETIGEAETDATMGFAYLVRDLPPGRYAIYAGTDRDRNGLVCEMGDLCGALPSTIEPAVIELSAGEALTGADFVIALQVLQSAGADSSASPRPLLRRLVK